MKVGDEVVCVKSQGGITRPKIEKGQIVTLTSVDYCKCGKGWVQVGKQSFGLYEMVVCGDCGRTKPKIINSEAIYSMVNFAPIETLFRILIGIPVEV